VVKRHRWGQIGTRDAEGYRTFCTPGDVCEACSNWETGLMVPVSQCPLALDDYYRENSFADREFDERSDAAFRYMRAYRLAG
jgi:hypothetical protein